VGFDHALERGDRRFARAGVAATTTESKSS
jgi:hypothetical protein